MTREHHEPEFYCPQCGEDTERLHEGYCQECHDDRQARLHDHNFRFNRWQKLSEKQRDAEIKAAIRNA